jgi:hypothetical protein
MDLLQLAYTWTVFYIKMGVILEVKHFDLMTTNISTDHSWYALFLNKQNQPLLTQGMVTSFVNITRYSKPKL